MRRLIASIVIMFSLILIAVPLVSAQSETQCWGCPHTISVVPVGSKDADGPLVTTTPADLMIFKTGSHSIQNVWLLIVLNKPTYDALDKITIKGSTFMTKADFQLVTAKKIPPTLPNPSTGYPGSTCQYEVSAIRSNMEEDKNAPLYYGIKYFLPTITKKPTYFTLTVELNSNADLKALILALGRCESSNCRADFGIDCITYKPLDCCSSFSKSTLVVPEAATLALTTAPLAGIVGLYAVKRRKK